MPNSETDILSLVCCADDGYAMPLAVTLFSAAANLSRERSAVFHLVDGGISAANKSRIEEVVRRGHRNVQVSWIAVDANLLRGLPLTKHLNEAAYLRLLVPAVLPATVAKVIYLDCDVIVQRDLSELWQTELDGNLLLAVQDFGVPRVGSYNGIRTQYERWGLTADDPYFNSGVMVIDLKKWRQRDISRRVIEFTRENQDTNLFCDQDGLNAVVGRDWKKLPLRWNSQVGALRNLDQIEDCPLRTDLYETHGSLLKEASILHFTGAGKPWTSGLRSPARPIFLCYLRRSGWFGTVRYRSFRIASDFAAARWYARSRFESWQYYRSVALAERVGAK
jgi:lipopolysaccharide biosynthesis glycosyltransferase